MTALCPRRYRRRLNPVGVINDQGIEMSDKSLPSLGAGSFEALKKTNRHGAEYWSARDLQPTLGYSQWRRFEQAIERAVTSCKQSGNNADHHFAGAGKMIEVGKGCVREVPDYHLSRFACHRPTAAPGS